MAQGRKTGGRTKGTPNKRSVEQGASLSEMARQHTDLALSTMVDICRSGENENARLTAANMLLDRGYGRAVMVAKTESEVTVVHTNARDKILTILARRAAPERAEGDTGSVH